MKYESDFFPYRREGQVAERPHLNLPADTVEEEIGLNGFFGAVTHLYHRHAPTAWSSLGRSSVQWPSLREVPDEFLRPQCFRSAFKEASGFYGSSGASGAPAGGFFWKKALFFNNDIQISLRRLTDSDSVYFRNADAHEIHFVHDGELTLESPWGSLACRKGDYIVVPKGITFRFKTTVEASLFSIESFGSSFQKPDTGILGLQALYHQEGIRSPKLEPLSKKETESRVRIQKEGRLTEVVYPFDIRDIAGWCGTLYPFALSVHSIAPVLSSVAHLPPSVNSTFVTSQFVVCTFLPRPLEEPEGALRVPFFHSNIDFDELIFYHEGSFFSRDHMERGAITLHPRGINHGPHPKALKNQNSVHRTDEIAVMVDTLRPLKICADARELEMRDYWKSWQEPKGA